MVAEIISIILILHIGMNLIMFISWRYMVSRQPKIEPTEKEIFISVVIAVRNESANILDLLKDLQYQSLSKSMYELVLVNDHSTDSTMEIAAEFKKNSNISIQLIDLEDGQSTKKEALKIGIENSKGNYIITTDGDCRLGTEWLIGFYEYFATDSAVMLCGPVTFKDEGGLFQKLQTIEFASLIGSGAATLGLSFGSMCNGANLAFQKKAYFEVNGYGGQKYVSGDDQIMLTKLMKKFPGKVKFIKDDRCIVTTHPKKSLIDFYHQRRRWAGKWKSNTDKKVILLAIFVFMANLNLLIAAALCFSRLYPVKLFLLLFIIKFLSEFVFLNSVMNFLGKRLNILYLFILQLIYPIYIVFFGLAANTGQFEWKGRKFGK